MDEDQMNKILGRLDRVIHLLAFSITNRLETQQEQIIQLSNIGFRPIEIANILRTTQNNVNKTLSEARKDVKL